MLLFQSRTRLRLSPLRLSPLGRLLFCIFQVRLRTVARCVLIVIEGSVQLVVEAKRKKSASWQGLAQHLQAIFDDGDVHYLV